MNQRCCNFTNPLDNIGNIFVVSTMHFYILHSFLTHPYMVLQTDIVTELEGTGNEAYQVL